MTHTTQDEHVFKVYEPELFGKMRPNKGQLEKVGLLAYSIRTDDQIGVTYYYHDYRDLRSSEMSTHLSKYPTIPTHSPPLPFRCIDPIGEPMSTPLRIDFLHRSMSIISDTTQTIRVNKRITEIEKKTLIRVMNRILRMSLYLSQKNVVWLDRLVAKATKILKDMNPDKVIDPDTWISLVKCIYPFGLSVGTFKTILETSSLQSYEFRIKAKDIKRNLSHGLDDLSDSDLRMIVNGKVYVVEEHTKDPFVEENMEQPSRPHVVSKPDSYITLLDLDH